MRERSLELRLICASCCLTFLAHAAVAADPNPEPRFNFTRWTLNDPPAAAQPAAESQPVAPTAQKAALGGHRGVSSFFNVREAYANVDKGEWELEAGSAWLTRSNHQHDEVEFWQSIKYGITDDFYAELEVSEPAGTGGEGVGELEFTLFNTFWHEADLLPAFAGMATLRIPTGYESSGVDGKFTGIFTKTLFPRFRGHFMGFVETANGAQGGDDENRRAFQWGLGPGFDYEITEDTLAVVNYLHTVSEEYGEHNNNVLEVGVLHSFPKTGIFKHTLKFAMDVGLDGLQETPNLGAKLQWEIEW